VFFLKTQRKVSLFQRVDPKAATPKKNRFRITSTSSKSNSRAPDHSRTIILNTLPLLHELEIQREIIT
jgi:hypothetical protein